MSAQGKSTGAKHRAAASSKVPASKKPAKVKAVVPTNLRTEQARLFFKCADSTQWVELPRVGKNKTNVGPVIFNGDISITQKARGNRCILSLGKSNYTLQGGRFILGSADDHEEHILVGCFLVKGPGSCRLDTDKGNDESIALASAFPLATLSSTFTEVRLVVPSFDTNWKQDVGDVTSKPEVLRGQLVHLCTGHSSANLELLAPASSVAAPATPALPVREADGKGKEVDTSGPVTVPASEQLKTFVQKADERRKAAIAAGEAKLAAMDTKFSAERAKVEQEQAESLRLLNEDIAAEEEGLRFEAQMEGVS